MEGAIGNKDDAEPIFWRERLEMYEKEPPLFRGLWVGWGQVEAMSVNHQVSKRR